MASIEAALKRIARWEGGFSDHVNDKGGRTKHGVTEVALARARKARPRAGYPADVADLTLKQAHEIFELDYAPKGWAKIEDQTVATLLLDVCINSGPERGVTLLQRALCSGGSPVAVDGKFGPKTLAAVNASNPEALRMALYRQRAAFYQQIVASDPTQRVFLGGWMNRLNDLVVPA